MAEATEQINEEDMQAQRERHNLIVHGVSAEEADFEAEWQETSLCDLILKECEIELDFKHSIIQLLCIMQPESTKNDTVVKSCYQKGCSNRKATEIECTRMCLHIVTSTTYAAYSQACACLVQSGKDNSNW